MLETSLSDRTHVPFAARCLDPIYFRRVIDRLLEIKRDLKGGRSGSDRFGFWASPPSDPCPPAPCRRTVPALGFASCRVVDTRSCTRAGSTPLGSSVSGRRFSR